MPKLRVDKSGKIICGSNKHLITYNSPFPTHNGSPGGFYEPADGYVLHTEVGYEHNVIAEFNNPGAQASSFFSIGMDGHIHQYGPVGKRWKAWTQAAGNAKWRGVEHEDHGNPKNPFTKAQIDSTASLIAVLSKLDHYPIQPTDNVNGGKGVAFHSDGGVAWGGHDCPGAVRRAQRPEIIRQAKKISGSIFTKPNVVITKKQKVRELQRIVHVQPTGKLDRTTKDSVQAILDNKHNKVEQSAIGAKVDGTWNPGCHNKYEITVHRLQRLVGVKEDGILGPQTKLAIDKFLKKVA